MSTASSRALIRLLAAAFLLLLGSGKDGRARIPEPSDSSSNRGIATANLSAALATTPVRYDVDPAQQQLLACEAHLHNGRVQSAPAPTRCHSWLCSCERALRAHSYLNPLQLTSGVRRPPWSHEP